jgi:hypothetical protein
MERNGLMSVEARDMVQGWNEPKLAGIETVLRIVVIRCLGGGAV